MTTTAQRPPPLAPLEPRLAARRAATAQQGARRRRRRLVVAGVVLVLALGALVVLHSRWFSVDHVKIEGVEGPLAARVLEVSGLGAHPPLVSLDPAAVAARIEALPTVGAVEVQRHWPDRVTVVVGLRRPVGVVGRPGGGYAEVDATGRVLGVVATVPHGLVLLGVPSVPGAPGSFLAAGSAPVLRAAAALPKALSDLVVAVGETPRGVQLDLVSPVPVVLGAASDLRAKYEAAASVLAAATFAPGDVLDVTVPSSPVVTGPQAG